MSAPAPSETAPLLGSRHDGKRSIRTRFASLSQAYYISPVVFMMSLAAVLTTTTTVEIMRQFACRLWFIINNPDVSNPTFEQCDTPGPKKAFSFSLQVIALINGFGIMISYGAIGRFSTLFGRKPVLVVLIALSAVASSCFIVGVHVEGTLSDALLILWIFIGASASVPSFGLIASMYVVDIVDAEGRTSIIGQVVGHAVLGTVPSYWLGGFITERFQNGLLVFWCQLVINVIAFLYAIFILPESLSPEKRAEARRQPRVAVSSSPARPVPFWKKPGNFVVAVLEPLKCLAPTRNPRTGRRNWRLLTLTASQFVANTSTMYIGEAFLIYVTVIFNFTPDETGFLLTSMSAVRVVLLSAGMPALIKYTRPLYNRHAVSEELHRSRSRSPYPRSDTVETVAEAEEVATGRFDFWISFWSSIVYAVLIVLIGLAKTRLTIKICVVALSVSAVHYPALRSLIVATVPPVEHGEALAAVDMVASLGSLVAPLTIGAIMNATVNGKYPQLSFYVCAAVAVVGSLILLLMRDEDRYIESQDEDLEASEEDADNIE